MLLALAFASLAAATLRLDFDSAVTSPPSYAVDATAYLAANGITISSLTPGTSVRIIGDLGYYNGEAVRAPSSPNTLTQTGSNAPVQFTLRFAVPLDSFSFKRSSLIARPIVSHPFWRAAAFNAAGAQIGPTLGESRIGSGKDVPAATFTLRGPGIASVRFNSENQGSGFNAVVLDDFVLTVPATRVHASRPPSPVMSTATQTISAAAGGTINLPGNASVVFDHGSLSQDSQVTVELLNRVDPWPANQNFAAVGNGLRVTLSNGALIGPMTLRIPFTAGANYDGIIGSVASSATFVPAIATVDQASKTVSIRFDASKALFSASSREAQGLFTQYASNCLRGEFPHNDEGLRRFDGKNWVSLDPATLTGLAGKNVIIAVHGMLSDLKGTYEECESSFGSNANMVILGFQYDFNNAIHISADTFGAALRALNFSNPGIKVNVVAHSEGTLVSAGAILDSTFAASNGSMIKAFYPMAGMATGTPAANSNTAFFKTVLNSPAPPLLLSLGALYLSASDIYNDLSAGIKDMGTGSSSFAARYLSNANRNASIPVVAYGHDGDAVVPRSSWSSWSNYFPNTTTIVDPGAGHKVQCSDISDIVARIQPPSKPQPIITSFVASPAAIKPGESSMLQWGISNAKDATLTGFGHVELIGSRVVMPSSTASYTLTATTTDSPTITATATVDVASACSSQQVAGGNDPATVPIEMGKNAGSFQFEYQTYDIPDEIIVRHENEILFDTTCVGASGSVILNYAGTSTKIIVQVLPNCHGDTSTGWTFTVGCPF